MNILITGAAGFIGGFLTRHCVEDGSSVLGIDIRELKDASTGAAFELCDVRDFACFSDLISRFRPDRVFHLAAQSYPTVSLIRPQETMDTNAGGTINLFEGLRASGIKPVVVVACSSAEYGPVDSKDLPVQESHSLSPLHPYGVSKVTQDLLAAQYFVNYSFPAIRMRIFNTTGPGKIGDVCSDLTRRAVEIERGIRPPIMMVGNLTTRRALADVRDLVRALWLSAESCRPGEVYNIGADQIFSVQQVIEAIRTQVGVSFTVEQQPDLVRAFDEPVIAGNTAKFRSCCEWTPKIDLTATLRDMLGWWRVRLDDDVRQSIITRNDSNPPSGLLNKAPFHDNEDLRSSWR
jgi:GDP-4-dehydro-6-deoxy-D-mannose reductase